MFGYRTGIVAVLGLFLYGAVTASADELGQGQKLVGVQASVATFRKDWSLDRADVYATWPTSLQREWASGWALGVDWHATVGRLTDNEKNDLAMASLGWRIIGAHRCGFLANLGWRPTLLSGHELAHRSLGGALQFSSQFRLGWRFCQRLEAGVALEHISNGGIASPNPGVDQVLVDVGLRF